MRSSQESDESDSSESAPNRVMERHPSELQEEEAAEEAALTVSYNSPIHTPLAVGRCSAEAGKAELPMRPGCGRALI